MSASVEETFPGSVAGGRAETGAFAAQGARRGFRSYAARLPWRLWGTLWIAFLLRHVNLAALPLLPDEAYYWLWSRHLDWAYYDHPAGTALLLRLSTALGGQSEFGIRWLNVLLSTACVALVWGLEERLSTRRTVHGAAWVIALGAPYLIVSRFVYTDVLFLFLLLLNVRCFLRLLPCVHRHAPRMHGRFAAWGLTLMLLLNTKYTAFLYLAGLGLWLLLRRSPLLRDRRFWISGTLAMLGLLPVAGWNAARDWASFRWQLSHFLTVSPGAAPQSLVRMWVQNARHATGYLTWPVVASGLVAAGVMGLEWRRGHAGDDDRARHGEDDRARHTETGLLSLLGLVLLGPVLLSPAGSPRNLLGGLIFILLGPSASRHRPSRCLLALMGGLAAFVALYGGGTVAALGGVRTALHSSVVREARRDVAGLHDLAQALAQVPERTLFVVDYSLAAQLAYYTEKPVTTSWGQYRIWAQPDLSSLVLVSLHYVAPERIDRQLRSAYTVVNGPFSRRIELEGGDKWVYWWRAEGLRWTDGQVIDAFDFFTLAEAHP